MELNREQIIKALECHIKGRCYDCPIGKEDIQSLNKPCSTMIAENALALIRELTEDNTNKDETIAGLICAIEKAYGDENRVILLPLSVGDTVYAEHRCGFVGGKAQYEVAAYVITNIHITQNKKLEWVKKYRAMLLQNGKIIDSQLNFGFEEIGSRVFTSRLELEKEIEGRKNNEHSAWKKAEGV